MEATVGDKRFDDYYRGIRLGLRLMSHGARLGTASVWSELTQDQLITLRQRWMPWADDGGFRGPAHSSFTPFFRSALKASQAAIFVGICRMVGFELLKPCVEGGEKLCEAYEIYREWEPDDPLTFDQAALLATGAISGKDIKLSNCERCRCARLIDTAGKVNRRCARCRKKP